MRQGEVFYTSKSVDTHGVANGSQKGSGVKDQVVGVIGLGPVGTILGAHLARSGVKVFGVELVAERSRQVATDGLLVVGHTQLHERVAGCFGNIAELSRVEGLGAVFLCTKTYAIHRVMTEFAKHSWPEEMRVVALMNGIGPEDAIGEHIDKDRVCRGVVNYAGNLSDDGAATMHWFHPPNLIGPATDRDGEWAAKMAETLSVAGLATVNVSHVDLKKAAFYKTILNSALNALCAAHGLTMNQAMQLKHTRRMARDLLREGLAVAAMVGYNYGEDVLDRCMKYLEDGGNHYPSMWFDLKHRRPTEIEFMNGKIVGIGRMFRNVDVDLNQFFTSAIVTQEIRNGTRARDDVPDYLVEE